MELMKAYWSLPYNVVTVMKTPWTVISMTMTVTLSPTVKSENGQMITVTHQYRRVEG